MQYPLLRGGDSALGRTDCSGRLIIDLPPAARDKFDGASALQADLDYSIQPAADGAGLVVEASGTDYPVQRLVAAATLLSEAQSAAKAAVGRTYQPSFDCAGELSTVEKMICQDETLSRLDRELAKRYRDLRQGLPPERWEEVADGQDGFLERRNQCADTACVKDIYTRQLRSLPEVADQEPSAAVTL
jgi:uncharacterized protein YecT (DUF1311 family)